MFSLDIGSFLNDPFGRRESRQQNLDNQFRREQADLAEEWRNIERQDRNTVIQRTVSDARRAGIGPLAAMGAAGSHASSYSVPVGQGGRVSGRSRPSATLSFGAGDQRNDPLTEAITEKAQHDADIAGYKAEQEHIRSMNMYDERFNKSQSPMPNVYLPAVDNIDQARDMIKQGLIPYLNPDLNLEMPEVVGGYYFGKPRLVPGQSGPVQNGENYMYDRNFNVEGP